MLFSSYLLISIRTRERPRGLCAHLAKDDTLHWLLFILPNLCVAQLNIIRSAHSMLSRRWKRCGVGKAVRGTKAKDELGFNWLTLVIVPLGPIHSHLIQSTFKMRKVRGGKSWMEGQDSPKHKSKVWSSWDGFGFHDVIKKMSSKFGLWRGCHPTWRRRKVVEGGKSWKEGQPPSPQAQKQKMTRARWIWLPLSPCHRPTSVAPKSVIHFHI